jgi:hypothetical protein
MAKQFSITASVNGGAAVSHNVVVKDTEGLFEAGFLYRIWKAFGMSQDDTFLITAISGPTSVSEPMSWDSIPFLIIRVVAGQISLAFID